MKRNEMEWHEIDSLQARGYVLLSDKANDERFVWDWQDSQCVTTITAI